VSEAEAHRDSLGKEAYEVRKEVNRLGSQLSKVEADLGRVKRKLLDSKSKLKMKEQQRDKVGNEEELGRLEAKIEAKRTGIEEVVEDWRKVQEEVVVVEVNLKQLQEQHAAAQAKMLGLSEQMLLQRQRKETLNAAHKTLEVKISRNRDNLEVLDKETSLHMEDIKECQTVLLVVEGKAREMTGGEELEPIETLEKLEAMIEALMKERLERGETDYGTEALKTHTEMASQINLKVKKIDHLKQFSKNLEDQMGSRRELFQTLRDKVVDMVERRFSALAGQTLATMQLRLSIDPMKKQLSFRFGPDQRSSKVGSLSGGEKSYSQLCLILSLWHFMTTPFRCLDEWDVFLDSVNRATIGAELARFAASKEGTHQFIFLSPQGAVETPADAGEEFRVFTLGEVSS